MIGAIKRNMGGWSYESILPSEVNSLMGSLGFVPVREFAIEKIVKRHLAIYRELGGADA